MRQHKYNAKKTIIDGITFDSQIEARRYQELKLLQMAGEIFDLQLQPQFVLLDKFTDNTGKKQRGIIYKADFQYNEDGLAIVEDVKGFETKEFKIKAKWFLSKYPEYQLRITK